MRRIALVLVLVALAGCGGGGGGGSRPPLAATAPALATGSFDTSTFGNATFK